MIPVSITNPIMDTTLISIPVIRRARKPPVNASGIVNMTINGDLSDWNWATITRYTSTMPRRIIRTRSFKAFIMDSFAPSNSMLIPGAS